MSTDQLKSLERFSACDISDALLKLKVPHAGFIPDLELQNTASQASATSSKPLFAPISTVLFAPKSHVGSTYKNVELGLNIPNGAHYVDHTPTEAGQAVLMSAPAEATCAVLGGIMALRMSIRDASGIIVDGRVRDLAELRKLDIPVWSSGTSTVGAGEGTKVWARDVPLTIRDISVKPGDIVCADSEENGVVIIPRDLLDNVLALCPRLTAADEKIVDDVRAGGTVKDAFAKHRSSL